MSAFDKKLEHLLINYPGSTSAQHDIRQLNIYTENSKFKILSMKERKRNYFIRKKTNSNLRGVATDDDEIGNAKFQRNTVAVPTTTHEIMSTEEFISNEIQPENGSIEQVISGNSAEKGTNGVTDDDIVAVSTATTTPVFTDIESNGEIVSKDVAAADDDIDNAKSPLIGDLDGINNEYYQEKENNNINETATSTIITDIVSNKEVVTTDDVEIDNAKIHSSTVAVTTTTSDNLNLHGVAAAPNIPNDGEILLLPLFSSEY